MGNGWRGNIGLEWIHCSDGDIHLKSDPWDDDDEGDDGGDEEEWDQD